MEIPYNYTIHDTRSLKDFKGITICGYKRIDVVNTFQNSIINNKIEESIRWCVELHCTGLNNQLWNSFETVYIKYIHVNNPKLFFYILKRKKDYLNIIRKYPKKHEIFTRNNQEIRNLYAELTAILTNTKKNNLFLPKSLPSIKKGLLDKSEIKKRMISKDIDKIYEYIYDYNSNYVKLGLNEIINNLLNNYGTFQNCIYWYLWLEKVEKNNIEQEYEYHWTFILWKILLDFENKLDKNNFIFIRKMEYIYKKDFKLSHIIKKKYYFFISFYIIKNNINWNINLFQNEYLIIQTNSNINSMYKSIINNIEKNIGDESKNMLSKNYYKLYSTSLNKTNKTVNNIKKIKDTYLDEELNKVMFTYHPEYKFIQEIQEKTEFKEENNLISKNMTERDIINQQEESQNKKLEAFTNFISYKKKENHKNVLDYYQNENNQNNQNMVNYKNIIFSKRK
jgi:hypothetical protein